MNRPKVLIIASFPPPVHGSAVMSQYIKESKIINESYDCDYVNLSTSRKIDEIGNRNPLKILRLLGALLKELWLLFTNRYALCYLAITCHGKGFLKDAPFVLLCKLFRKKIVIHQHNKGMSRDIERWPYRWLLPLVYRDATVILLSWRLYPDIEKMVPKENVVVCPNGIPDVGYEYKERNNPVPRLLFLNNLIPSKGVYVLLDALEILGNKGLLFVCDFVGSESKNINKQKFIQEVRNRRLDRQVVFYGAKYGHEKRAFLENADIFVHPTSDDCLPLVLLEALQYGLPIVATYEGGIPDIVNDGENGFLCKKCKPKSLADRIEKLLYDENLRLSMGNQGYEKYNKEYTIQTFEKRIIEIIDDLTYVFRRL